MAVIDEFLKDIFKFLKAENSAELANYLRVEPDGLPDAFQQLCQELKDLYHNDKAIERKVSTHIPEDHDHEAVSASFQFFIQIWLQYWRDVDFTNLVTTHAQLFSLTNACVQAFSHPKGLSCLQTAIRICDALARLAMQLDQRRDLTVNIRTNTSEDSRKSLVEATAEIIQKAFTTCLNARTSTTSGVKDGKPEGKKSGIYSFANLVLKLFFQSRTTRSASQLFTNISQNSPPLRLYPERQRVTFLYYLGRFHFSNNHFYFAQACLQGAYDQCHSQFLSQKRMILIYLISANMILGRFPSQILMMMPEATGLAEKFDPILNAIRKGDLMAFKHALGPEHGNEQWFFYRGLLLALQSRCEVLVWRSLARRVFLLTYNIPWDPSDKFPALNYNHVVAAAQYCQKRLEGWERPRDNELFVASTDLAPPPHGKKKLKPQGGVIYCNKIPEVIDIEPILASLCQQKLLRGWLNHEAQNFRINGSRRAGGPLNAGFPPVWQVIKTRVEGNENMKEIPGWVQKEPQKRGGVIMMSNVKGIGE
ncbi:COP9 signalosome-like protein complex subunit 12 [Calycina marina]|uniref:COP9 signalosome-like protein complex subunit 12 n=1 Tax=Calycina marina TaxID=1763456 RepID=A0A9P8CBJ8_9HELO|nr:COP9 signalosome-like protein complex subunit 12 [Calycina marina]